jgi:hypothetical protein
MNKHFVPPIPKWVVKNQEFSLPNNNMLIIKGKRKDDFYFIFKNKADSFHIDFSITKDAYGVRTKNEKTHAEPTVLLNRYSDVIIQLTEHWKNKKPHLVKELDPKFWEKHTEMVIDINSDKIPTFLQLDEMYYVEPHILRENCLFKEDVIKMKFTFGLMFDAFGEGKGMILSHKKSKKLILVDRELIEPIMNTAIAIDSIKDKIIEQYEDYKKNL